MVNVCVGGRKCWAPYDYKGSRGIAGLVDRVALELSGVSVFPEDIAPEGCASYLPSVLGCYPFMGLFAEGIKVGVMLMVLAFLGRVAVAGCSPARVFLLVF